MLSTVTTVKQSGSGSVLPAIRLTHTDFQSVSLQSTCTNCVHLDAPLALSEELVVKDLDSGRYVRADELLLSRHATLSP